MSECRLGVYDLAEKKLMHYPSNLATYDEIKNSFITLIEGKKTILEESSSHYAHKINEKDYNIHPPESRKGDDRL